MRLNSKLWRWTDGFTSRWAFSVHSSSSLVVFDCVVTSDQTSAGILQKSHRTKDSFIGPVVAEVPSTVIELSQKKTFNCMK